MSKGVLLGKEAIWRTWKHLTAGVRILCPIMFKELALLIVHDCLLQPPLHFVEIACFISPLSSEKLMLSPA